MLASLPSTILAVWLLGYLRVSSFYYSGEGFWYGWTNTIVFDSSLALYFLLPGLALLLRGALPL